MSGSGERIHSTAIVDGEARLADDVEVGAYSVIGPGVEIGAGTRVGPHVVIQGPTRIGRDNRIYQFASVGDAPQDKKFAGEATRLEIGDRNTIREFVTINRGTVQDAGVTRIGDENWIMAYVHIAHDCQVGNDVIFANNASLAGHVHIDDHVILGGFSAVHQFCRIGAHAFTAAGTIVTQDVPPYVMAAGYRAAPLGLNAEGLKRRGYTPEQLKMLRRAYKLLYRSGLKLEEALERMRAMAEEEPAVAPLVSFVEGAQRGIIR